jgi:hypothetical protein
MEDNEGNEHILEDLEISICKRLVIRTVPLRQFHSNRNKNLQHVTEI